MEKFLREVVSTNETQRSERPRELAEFGKKADTDCVTAISDRAVFFVCVLNPTVNKKAH